jgi:hypothetical protein
MCIGAHTFGKRKLIYGCLLSGYDKGILMGPKVFPTRRIRPRASGRSAPGGCRVESECHAALRNRNETKRAE